MRINGGGDEAFETNVLFQQGGEYAGVLRE
jgi:hypothetical protein